MKKFLLFFAVSLFSVAMFAQTIESLKDGAAFSMTSPNGAYLVGNMEDAAAYYNVQTRTIKSLQGEMQDDGGCTAWDINDKGQVAVDWKGHAAIWTEKGEFEPLPLPNGWTAAEEAYNAARCLSNDGKYVVVSFGSPTTTIFLYTLGEDGVYTMEKVTCPEVAPIYNQVPQFIAPCGITNDGNRILGRFLVETGEFELPFVWERTPGGDWTIRWIADEFIVEGGKTDAVFYGTEFVFDGDQLEDPEGYEAAYNEWLAMREDYYATIDAVSSGYFFQGTMGDLSDLAMSANGKYAKMNISFKDLESEDTVVYNYPAVIDLETEEVYVFDAITDGGCLSVTNDGIASLGTPAVEYFRYAYVVSVSEPNNVMTLSDWCLTKTGGKIDLADYMMYPIDDTFVPVLATGTATLASEGTAFMTYQWNLIETGWQETFFVQFGNETTSINSIESDRLGVYPNPTNGFLYFPINVSDIEVFDITGRKVYASSVVANQIDLSMLDKGNYIIIAKQNDKLVKSKIIIL